MIKTFDRFLKSRLFFWVRISQFILALCIFTGAALLPGDKLPEISSDQTLHFFGNTLLFLSASVAFMGRTKLGLLVLLLVPYSLLIEMGQSLSPGRQVDIHDVWANVSGLAAGYLLVHLCEWVWCKISGGRKASS